MKPKVALIGFCALTLVAVLTAIVMSRNFRSAPVANVRTFQVHGQIRSVDAANKTVRIAHEAIPNYMPAMTMPLFVKEDSLLNGLTAGENVQFELSVTENDSWISHIDKISAEPSSEVARGLPDAAQAKASETERIQTGEIVPDFGLIDQNGRAIRLSEFRGRAVVLTFIYTRCPLPNFCPLMSKNFAELEQRLRKEFPNKFQLLSVSMDPEFDRPAILKKYAERFEANEKDWNFATGDAEQIQFVASLMGLYYAKENGLISHDLRTALIGPDGRLVHLWKSNVWTPYEVQRLVRETLTGVRDVAGR
jgi:protein SCO1/2